MTILELKKSISRANYFYRIGMPIVPDQTYDSMIERLQELDPDSDLLSQIGYRVSDRKVTLPIVMASMNKIKTVEEIADWFRLKSIPSKTQIIITPKYDGLSLCVNEKHQIAYTRGDGKIGQLSTLHYEMMKNKLTADSNIDFTFGEAIMPKSVFMDNYSGEFANARNLVSGLFNSKEPSVYLEDCVYIKYGAHGHNCKTKQELLDKLNYSQAYQVPYFVTSINKVDDILIKKLFKDWSKEFEIDGLILEINDFENQEVLGRETSTNNPVWARALKHKSFESSAITTVNAITWNISKQGYLKPTINVKPVVLDGVVISNVTGNNARYVKEMGIGVGSEVEIVRSGMVIPVITNVLTKKPFEMPDFPNIDWNDNGIELVALGETTEQIVKKIVSFFQILEADGISEGTIKQLITHPNVKMDDFKTALKSIFDLKVEDMCQIYRFGNKKASAVYSSMRKCCTNVELPKIQHATGVFENLGSRKLELVKHFQRRPSVEEVMEIDGFAEKSANIYVKNWVKFYNFINALPITLSSESEKKVEEEKSGDDLDGLSFCFTGIRVPEIEKKIQSRGGKIASGVTKNTNYLIMKSKGSGSSKEQKAMQLGIQIFDVEELEKFLN